MPARTSTPGLSAPSAGLIVTGLVLTVAGVPLALRAQSKLTAPVPEPAPVAA